MYKTIPAIDVTDAMLVDTNVAEDDAPEFSMAGTYSDGERVIVAALHKVYESAIDDNTGNDPATDDGTLWIEVGATRPWRVFDDVISEPITNPGTIRYLLQPDQLVRGVGLINVSAVKARVRVLDPDDNELSTVTKYLADYSAMVDSIAMVTVPPGEVSTAIFEDVICAPGNRIEIVIGDGTGSPSVSEIVVGDVLKIGRAQYGANTGILDWSRQERDAFGNQFIAERGWSDYAEVPILIPVDQVPRIKRELAKLRARYSLYFARAEGNDLGLTVYGTYRNLRIVTSDPTYADCNLELEGV